MKKIFILAGAVLLFVLLFTTWFFIIDLSDFAKSIGEKTKDTATDEKSKFIGTWETTYIEGDDRFVGYNGVYKFSSDGTGTIGGLICSWDIKNNKLVIDYFEESMNLIYDYFFSENYELLTLINSKGTLEFSKSII
jgi:hypothetical protein